MALDTIVEAGVVLAVGVVMDTLHAGTAALSLAMTGVGCAVTLLWSLYTASCASQAAASLKYEALDGHEEDSAGAVVLGREE